MVATRRRLTALLAVAALAVALPACRSDDAAERDAKDAQEQIDKDAGRLDEKAGEAAEDAADEVEKGAEDVDGK